MVKVQRLLLLVLIETLWNVKLEDQVSINTYTIVLIETLWNVKREKYLI